MKTPSGIVTRAASFSPSSANEETRTIDMTWTTGARVMRSTWADGNFVEELSTEPKHVRMGRLASGSAPLLANHDDRSIDSVIGVVQSARLENGQGVATVRFAKDDPEAEKAWNKVKQGVLPNVSVGYRVHKFEKVEGGDKATPVYRAVDWEPLELSVVPIGADAGAKFRSSTSTGGTMETETQQGNNQVDAEQIRMAERERAAEINKIARTAKMPGDFAERMISDGKKVEDVRALAFEEMAKRSEKTQIDGHLPAIEVGGQRGGHDDFRAAAADGLLIRAGIQSRKKPHPAAADVARMRAEDLARTCLSRTSKGHGNLSGDALFKRAFSTSDFPNLLTDAMHKALRVGYEESTASHKQWVREELVKDFRDQHRPILGSAPDLDKVLEYGEYQEGSMIEDSTSYRVDKYGKIVRLSREVLVNDNLNAFMRAQLGLGLAALRKEADLVYSGFAGAGPTMQDSINLFDAQHGNVTAGALTSDALGAARSLLRKQKALGGGYLNLEPAILLVPPELEQSAEVILTAATRINVSNIAAQTPEWVSKLQIVSEPRLSDYSTTAFYVIARNDRIDTAVLGMLDSQWMPGGANGPVIEQDMSQDFSNDVLGWKVRHAIGTKFLDWRGIVKSTP